VHGTQPFPKRFSSSDKYFVDYVFKFLSISERDSVPEGQLVDFIANAMKGLDLNQECTPYIVTEEMAGKPFAVAKILYKSEDYTDIITTFNGISNPLSMAEGQIIYVPDLNTALKQIKKELSTAKEKNAASNKSMAELNKKLSVKERRTFTAVSKVAAKEGAVRTTNMTTKPQTIATDGEIILGANIIPTVKEEETNLAIAEVIKTELKAQLTEEVSKTNAVVKTTQIIKSKPPQAKVVSEIVKKEVEVQVEAIKKQVIADMTKKNNSGKG
jgi:hypothetical protein